ncbi:MAG: acyl-CoA dehydrogenase family protein [Candidatus Helarchaeota archaeon]
MCSEEFGAINGAFDMARGATCILFGTPLSKFGTDEQKEKYLKPVLMGEN